MSGIEIVIGALLVLGVIFGILYPLAIEVSDVFRDLGLKPQQATEAAQIARKGKPKRRRQIIIRTAINGLVMAASAYGLLACLSRLTDGENTYNFENGTSSDDPYFLGLLVCSFLLLATIIHAWTLITKLRAIRRHPSS
jgi:hypothetical protein